MPVAYRRGHDARYSELRDGGCPGEMSGGLADLPTASQRELALLGVLEIQDAVVELFIGDRTDRADESADSRGTT